MQYNTQQLTEIRKQIFPRYNSHKLYHSNELLLSVSQALFSWEYEDDFHELNQFKLQLLPLSSITDEESRLMNWSSLEQFMKFKHIKKSSIDTDILRSLGYATQQTVILDGKPVTLSVEEQIELGIIELKK